MKKVFYIVFALLLVGIWGTFYTLQGSSEGLLKFNTVEIHEKKEANGKGVENVNIESPSIDIKLTASNQENITAELKGNVDKKTKNSYELIVKENGNEVDILVEVDDKFHFALFSITSIALEVKVPEELYEKINIETSSGDVVTKSFESKALNIQTSSGDVNVKDSKIDNEIKIQSSSGDVITSDIQANKVEIDTESGDVMIDDQDSKHTQLHTSSGDIVLNEVNGDIVVEASSGDIAINNSEPLGNIDANSSSGDIVINFDKDPDSLTIDFEGNSGDGIVKLDGITYEDKSENEIEGRIGSGKYSIIARTSSGDFVLN